MDDDRDIDDDVSVRDVEDAVAERIATWLEFILRDDYRGGGVSRGVVADKIRRGDWRAIDEATEKHRLSAAARLNAAQGRRPQ